MEGQDELFSRPLEKQSAVVKVSQWVTRHYRPSAESDCAGCIYQALNGLPSMPSNG